MNHARKIGGTCFKLIRAAVVLLASRPQHAYAPLLGENGRK